MMMTSIVPWSALPDLGAVASLMGMAAGDLRAELSGFPEGIEGIALLDGETPRAAALAVWCDLQRTGVAFLARLSADEAGGPLGALALVDDFEARAAGAGARTVEVSLKRAPGVGPVLAERGYRLTNAVLRMRRGQARAAGPLPPGFDERPLTAAGVDAWLEVWNASFIDVPFTSPLRREDLVRRTTDPTFDAGLVRILYYGREPVGLMFGVLFEDGSGEVEMIGLLERVRGRGLGRWLLRRCAELLEDRCATEIVLRVAESNGPALALYRDDGWTEVSRSEVWRRAG
jgi:ribosomal protein S18 acetylase RimI-like enzyme